MAVLCRVEGELSSTWKGAGQIHHSETDPGSQQMAKHLRVKQEAAPVPGVEGMHTGTTIPHRQSNGPQRHVQAIGVMCPPQL